MSLARKGKCLKQGYICDKRLCSGSFFIHAPPSRTSKLNWILRGFIYYLDGNLDFDLNALNRCYCGDHFCSLACYRKVFSEDSGFLLREKKKNLIPTIINLFYKNLSPDHPFLTYRMLKFSSNGYLSTAWN